MLTDYDILGIANTNNISIIRKAYRKIVKRIHPDVAKQADLLKNHLLFIQVNMAYQRLLGQSGKKNRFRNSYPNKSHNIKGAVTKHKDPAYVFYKTGMTSFMKIHPSQWNMETKQILEKPSPLKEQELEKIKDKVRNLVRLFPRAYYYFSIVVHEYPHSVWFEDARQKMTLIEQRTVRYKKIIESFTEHAKEMPRVNRMFWGRKR